MSMSNGPQHTAADFSYLASATTAAEQRIAEISSQLAEMAAGRVPEQLLAEHPELQKAKQDNDKLKYRCKILEQSVANEKKRSATQTQQHDMKAEAPSKKRPAKNSTEIASGSILAQISALFEKAIEQALGSDVAAAHPPAITPAVRAQFGDYQFNSAMQIAQALTKSGTKTNPRQVAEKIKAALPAHDMVAKTEIAGPGFINIFLNNAFVLTGLSRVLLEGVKPPKLEKKRVVVDFSSPNIAKQMHVGHLRSTIIGDSICRLLEYIGFDVLRLNHIGDWGTQFGMLIAHLQDVYPDYSTTTPPIADLQAFYKESKQRFDNDEPFKARAYDCVVQLQKYEPKIVKAWQLICDVSRKDFGRIYDRLDITITERGESFYQTRMAAVVDDLKGKGLLRLEEGREIVMLDGWDSAMTIVKSDGGYTYDTSDLAAIKNRIFEEKADWIVYVVDSGQGLHLQQVYRVAREMGWYDAGSSRVEHVGFGLVLGEDKKKFKTRSGDTVRLTDLLDEGVKRAHEKLMEKERNKEMSAAELDRAAEAVAYGCIKYADLCQNHTQDYVFSFDRMLDDRGNTAVYLLYSYVRIRSIARSAGVSKAQVVDYVKQQQVLPLERASELKLAKHIIRFVDCILQVLDAFNLHLLCEYVYELSSTFTEFYSDCYCIERDDKGEIKQINLHRLALCEATADTMYQAFNILGIRPLDKM